MNVKNNVFIDFETISKGIAIGQALIYNQKQPVVNKTTISSTNIEKQILEFKTIIKDQIDLLKKNIFDNKNNLSKEEISIIEINLNFLQDNFFWEEVYVFALDNKINVDFAFKFIKDKYLKNFDQEDNYWLERAQDINNIFNLIVNLFQGNKLFNIDNLNQPTILIGNNFDLNLITKIDISKIVGIISYDYSPTSHSTIMIKNLNIPYIWAKNAIVFENNETIIFDATDQKIFFKPSKLLLNEYEKKLLENQKYSSGLIKYKNLNIKTKDNHSIKIMANINGVDDIDAYKQYKPDGIGLFRTEFLFINSANWPTEEEQFEIYKKIAISCSDQELIIRTLDIGSNKNLNYYKFFKEENPALGNRAIRFSLSNREIFKDQLKAIIRAKNDCDNIKIMFPMISTIEELKESLNLLNLSYKELQNNFKNLKPLSKLDIGIMIETPSSVFLSDHLAKLVSFFAIGSNDLIQYSFAVDRTNPKLTYLYQPYNPSLLRQINYVVKNAHKNNVQVCICGDIASEEDLVPILIGLDIDKLSLNIKNTWIIKDIISKLEYIKCKTLAKKSLKLDSEEKVKKLLK